ncbi:hypothetical protein Fcan01_17923 [Folsomia candida]|uniref:Uncharacterized protein n=1 Tax=Folsomia candida TaxID=158441 RepID=A0A226DT94_FOLCA|nr:hypothetical protein Fcan01_17923 [Folsomia candida]
MDWKFYGNITFESIFHITGFSKRGKKWDTLTVTLSIFTVVAAALPILFGLLDAYMTVNDNLAHLQYALANSVCPMKTYFTCKSITYIVVGTLYTYVGFQSTALLVGSVVNCAVILNMLMDSVSNLAQLDLCPQSIQTYQRFRVLIKNVDNVSSILATLLLLVGFLFTVMCNFTTVWMFRVIRMPFYLFFPTASVIGMVGIGILLPYGIACHEKSAELLAGWKGKLREKRGTMRLEEKMVKGLRPIGFKAGTGEFSFFVLKKSTKSRYYVTVTDKTIEALMT